MVEANPHPIQKQTSTDKHEKLMRECRELQERLKARQEKSKATDELVKSAQISAKSAINNYDKFKDEYGEVLEKLADRLIKQRSGGKSNFQQNMQAMREQLM